MRTARLGIRRAAQVRTSRSLGTSRHPLTRVLERLAGPHSLKGRDRIRAALGAQGLPSC